MRLPVRMFAVVNLMLVWFSASLVHADNLFPDKGLEAAVRAEVFEKRYNQEPLTAEDVKNISRVVGRGKAIKSLEGLQHCKEVMLIDFENNEIVDLTPMKDLGLLQSVTLAGNKIKDITPLAGLVKMQLLDISRNEISDLSAIKGMENLRDLWAADNQIKSLEPVKDLKKVWSVDIAGNGLSDLAPVAQLKWLTTLDAQRNAIKDLSPISKLTELDFLLLQKNQIEDLGVLVEMCEKDAKGDRRFAPYLQLYLEGNPLQDKAKGEQVEQLKKLGVKVFLEDPKPSK